MADVLNPSTGLSSSFGSSPQTITIPFTPTSGNRLWVAIWDVIDAGANSLTDNQSNTYTQVHSFTNNNGTPVQIYVSDVLSGTMPTTLSISWTGNNRGIEAMMAELSGLTATSYLDFAGTSTTGYGELEDITYATDADNEVAVAYIFIGGSRDFAITESGFSRLPTGSVDKAIIYKANVGALGSGKTLTATWTGGGSSDIGLTTFRIAAAGVDVNAVVVNMTTTAQSASVALDINVASALVALSLSTYAASVSADGDVQAAVQNLILTTHTANVDAGLNIDVGVVNMTMTPRVASVALGIDVLSTIASLVLSSHNAIVVAGGTISSITVSDDGTNLTVSFYSSVSLSAGVAGFAYGINDSNRDNFWWTDVNGSGIGTQTVVVPLIDIGVTTGDILYVDAGYSLTNPAGVRVYAFDEGTNVTSYVVGGGASVSVNANVVALGLTVYNANIIASNIDVITTSFAMTITTYQADTPLNISASMASLNLVQYGAKVKAGLPNRRPITVLNSLY